MRVLRLLLESVHVSPLLYPSPTPPLICSPAGELSGRLPFPLYKQGAVSIVHPPCALCGRSSLALELLRGRLHASLALQDKARLFLQMSAAVSTVPSNV